jgi:hypothetical protein
MALEATALYQRHAALLRVPAREMKALCDGVRMVATVQQSMRLMRSRGPAVIISASGMATGGRVLHHLKAMAPDARTMSRFPGFQVGGSRGARLVAGATEVKIHGDHVPVRAEVSHLARLLGPRRQRRPDGLAAPAAQRAAADLRGARRPRCRRCAARAHPDELGWRGARARVGTNAWRHDGPDGRLVDRPGSGAGLRPADRPGARAPQAQRRPRPAKPPACAASRWRRWRRAGADAGSSRCWWRPARWRCWCWPALAYARSRFGGRGHPEADSDPGLTTELALFVTYLLGVLALVAAALAAGAGVIGGRCCWPRASAAPLCHAALSEAELHDALLLAALALVLLPLLPAEAGGLAGRAAAALADRAAGADPAAAGRRPHGAALAGPRFGLALSGLFSRLRLQHRHGGGDGRPRAPEPAHAAVPAPPARCCPPPPPGCKALLLLTALSPPAAAHLPAPPSPACWWPCTWRRALGGAGRRGAGRRPGAGTAATARRRPPAPARGAGRRRRAEHRDAGWSAPPSTTSARAVYAAAALGALADAHSSVAALGSLHAAGRIGLPTLGTGVLVAIGTNALLRIGVALVAGGAGYGLRMALSLLASTGAAAAVLLLPR